MFIINCELICPRFPNRRIIHKSDLEEIPKTCLDIEIHSILSPYLVWSQSILHNQDLVYSYSNRNTKPFLPYPFEILLSFLFPSIFLCDHQSKGRDYLFLRFLYFYSFIHSHSLSLIFRCKFTQIIPIHQTKPQKTSYFYHQSPIPLCVSCALGA